ncbi:PREDICTED: uncharacterized protein LOC104703161 [Camelina sativa]|uniref:Uncharacterized protein LOC104703161 n=1 Tax=Camelina sativa TaxID=90675 RepID=A0ABM0SX69_CAMSA|nr:PREDICTED: uncharacterized protein LOC104703161 [Camelina sativa]
MRSPITLILVLRLLSYSLIPQSTTASSLFPFPFPLPLPFSLPFIFGGSIAGSGNSSDDELARRCFPDLGDGEACLAEIFGSFFYRQIMIGPECCKAILEIDQDCTQAIFKPFSSSYFSSSVNQYCTNN